MTEIPDDIMKAANECVAQFRWNNDNRWHLFVARAIQAERERDGWQPIETAPKDHTEILVGGWHYPDPDEPESHLGEYGYQRVDPNIDLTQPRWIWCKSSFEDYGHRRGFRHRNGANWATHWLPVPVPSAAVSEGGEDE